MSALQCMETEEVVVMNFEDLNISVRCSEITHLEDDDEDDDDNNDDDDSLDNSSLTGMYNIHST